jgi:hypothetical protein
MLSRKGNQPYRTWKAGERVLCIIDEKPSAWWKKESLTEEDLQQLTKTPIDPAIIAKAGQLLTQSPNTSVKLKVTPKQRQELRTLIATGGETEDEAEQIVRRLTALYSLIHTPGLVVDANGTNEIILTQRLPLPTLPTLILDGTGLLDPEYPSGVNILSINPWQGRPLWETLITVHLVTRNETLSKTNLDLEQDADASKKWVTLFMDVERYVLPKLSPTEQVYFVCSEQHPLLLEQALHQFFPTHTSQFIVDHYGNTKGSNRFREAAAIVFTSIQHKGDGYYRALAATTGKGDVNADTRTLGRRVRRFRNKDLEELKLRDQVTTSLQEIGRTRIRKGEPITIYLPWADSQGVSVIEDQLWTQFTARVMVRERLATTRTRKDQLLNLLQPNQTFQKREIVDRLGMSHPSQLSHLLAESGVADELWGREIDISHSTLSVPPVLRTKQRLDAALDHCLQTFAVAVDEEPAPPQHLLATH